MGQNEKKQYLSNVNSRRRERKRGRKYLKQSLLKTSQIYGKKQTSSKRPKRPQDAEPW